MVGEPDNQFSLTRAAMSRRKGAKGSLYGFIALLAVQMFLVGGCCTPELWHKETFARHYRPANPANLSLFYSEERDDFLVQYDELDEQADTTLRRSYWLQSNALRVNRDAKPRFVSTSGGGLLPIPVTPVPKGGSLPGPTELYAVAQPDDDRFELFSGDSELDPYKLPSYNGASQRVKQVLLTPIAVSADATVIGAIAGYMLLPYIFATYYYTEPWPNLYP